MLDIHEVLNNIKVETEEQHLVFRALGMLRDRAHYWRDCACCNGEANAYESAADILAYAMMGDWAAINNFDYYEHNEEPEQEEDFDCDWGYNEDMGFDPYMGCYSDDC